MRHSLLFLLFTGLLGLLPEGVMGLETAIVFTQVPADQGNDSCAEGSRLVILNPDQSLRVLTQEFS